jgi:acyl-CoA thioester hydrolase
MKHTTEIVVRSYECDSYGHVNNAVYLNYLEYARLEYLTAVGFDYQGLVAAGYSLYVTHIDIRYQSSARLGDRLSVEVEPRKLGRVSGTFRQTIRKSDGSPCAQADVTWASVTAGAKLAPIPHRFMVEGLRPE